MEIKGFTYGWDSHKGMLGTEKANESVKALAAMGGNWAALAFAVTQEKFSSSRFGMDFRFVDTDREIETAIKQLKDSGLKVCLKPILNCEDGTWRANITFPEREFPIYDEHGRLKSYWNEWFSCYTAFICHYAEIAEYTGCEMLCIGCEMIGTEAPDMRVGTGKDGKAVRLSDLKGKYVLINFWASWCPDCRRETPALQRLWQKYGDKGLQIAGISYDTNREAWQKYIADNKMEWWQYSELKKWKKETESDRLYHINWIPTLYLIAPDGRVALATVMMDKVEAELAKALGD